MHIYDLLMLGLLALLAWSGYRRGFVREVAGLAAFIVGFALAVRFAGPVGRWLVATFPSLSPSTARIIAFLAIVVLVGIGMDVAALIVTSAISYVPVVGGLNRFGGLVAGAVLGVLVVWLVTSCLLLLPPTLVPFRSGIRHSWTAQAVRNVHAASIDRWRTYLTGLGGTPKVP